MMMIMMIMSRLFEVRFLHEAGIDHGGLRREFFDLVTRYIFDPANGMFVYVEEGEGEPGSPVQPNPSPPAHVKVSNIVSLLYVSCPENVPNEML